MIDIRRRIRRRPLGFGATRWRTGGPDDKVHTAPATPGVRLEKLTPRLQIWGMAISLNPLLTIEHESFACYVWLPNKVFSVRH
jgi:hypothetical protein